MNEKQLIKKNIKKYFDKSDNRKIVVLPLRSLSGVVTDILRGEYRVQEQFIVDNYTYDMEHIYPMDRMPENARGGV